MKILYEAQFDNNSKSICRISAKDKKQAITKFKEVDPDKVVTKIYEP